MKLVLIVLFWLPGLLLANAEASREAQTLPAYSTRYDPARNAFEDGRDAIHRARQSGRHVLIELGGDWCTWCHVMDRFFEDNPDLKTRLHDTFVVLKINVSDANDNAAFLAAFPRPLGYPHMYVADGTGSIVLSKDTADFLHQGRYSRERFSEFFKQWTPAHDRQ